MTFVTRAVTDKNSICVDTHQPEVLYSYNCYIKGKCKGKAIPLQAWTGPAGSRGLRLPDFKTIGT
jgi:hypothetical protein